MTAKHSEAFIEQALVKVFSRGDRSVKSVAEDLNVSYYTLKYWMKSKSVTTSGVPATREKRPRTGLPQSSWSPCTKPMACPGKPCRRGAAKEAYSPII
jgi:transposase-like protein